MAAPRPPLEAELACLARLRGGDTAALEQYYHWYAERLYLAVASRGLPAQVAEEVVHDAFARFWERAPQLDHRDASAWPLLKRMAVNLGFDRLRRRRSVVVLADEPDLPEGPADDLGAIDALLDDERKAMVKETLALLSPAYAEVIQLRMLDGLSSQAAAEALGTTPNNVNVKLHRALKQFASRWPPR